MSPNDIGGPAAPFIEAVGGAALTATAMAVVGIRLDGTAGPVPPLPFLVIAALIVSVLVISMAAAFIGLPLTGLLARRGWESPWAYPASGLVLGGALTVGFFGSGWAGEPRRADEWLQIASLGAVPGLVCGASWWLLYRRHFRPGRPE